MALRASSLQSTNTLAINREIGSQYDVILEVSKHLAEIDTLANEDISGLINSLNEAKDFTGITVVTGETPSWDATNKILTVPVEKGDAGENGRGITSIELISTAGLTKTYAINYTDGTSSTFTVINGADGINGTAGKSTYQLWLDAGNEGTLNDFLEAMKGPKGSTGPQGIGIQGPAGVDGQDLTVEQIGYNGDGTFTWQFSDGTSYVTPNLKGPKGDTGTAGAKGDTGIGVHHIKGTSTTNPNGDFGTSPFIDTYTVYGDANEMINLGHFVVTNGVSDGMSMSVYDKNGNGIVDNSERLGGILAEDVFAELDGKYSINGGVISGDVTVTGDLIVNGEQMTVNTETVLAKDNLLVINDGEVGPGVTKGEAGIEIDRGTAENYKFVFVESDDSFKVGVSSGLQKVATREDSPLNTGVAVWDGGNYRFNTTRNVDADTISFGGSGQVSWNTDESTLDVVLGASTLQVGQETLVKVRASTDIGNGKVVMATGSLGNSGRIVVGLHDGTRSNGKRIVGVATHDIGNGSDGFVTAFGKVRNINTTGSSVGETWLDGDVLYVKPGGAGNLTKIVPLDSELMMPVAFVVHAHTNGTLFVRASGIDENRVATSARKLETGRTIGMTGDVTWTSASFDGTGNVIGTATLADSGVTAGTYDNVTVDIKGRVTTGTNNDSANISALVI